MTQRHELDLTVGDVFHIGETTITIIDIDDGEVTFRVDDSELQTDEQSNRLVEIANPPWPR